jgi:hypothetical protein
VQLAEYLDSFPIAFFWRGRRHAGYGIRLLCRCTDSGASGRISNSQSSIENLAIKKRGGSYTLLAPLALPADC